MIEEKVYLTADRLVSPADVIIDLGFIRQLFVTFVTSFASLILFRIQAVAADQIHIK